MAIICNYVLVLLFILSVNTSSASKCVKQSPCACTIDDYTFLNLSHLRPTEGAFFQDATQGKNNTVSYFFSGCEDRDFKPSDYGLIYEQTIQGASLVKCISTVVHPPTPTPKPSNVTTTTQAPNTGFIDQTCTLLGHAKDIKFDLVPSLNHYQIIYAINTTKSLPSVTLACDTLNRTDFKILSSDTDALIVYSPLVCVQHISHHVLSGGSVFCIIFFVTVFVYFVGGGLIMYFARGARGVEVIPNYDFWVAIPGLVKDGLIYLLNGCRPLTVITAETYDRI